MIKLIVGLGNPGNEYKHTRHNAGEDYVRALAESINAPLSADSKYAGDTAKAMIGGEPVWLLVPKTFMNRSGKSVGALANFYKINPEEILVAHDELDIPAGTGKLKQGGGHGGHNGLRDIIACLGNNKNFWRLRIGIGHPGSAKLVTSWVLSKAIAVDYEATSALTDAAIRLTPQIVKGDMTAATQTLHSIKPN